jgi:hypothetical protein
MLILVGIFLLALAVRFAAGDTPLGMYLHALLIETPARVLSGMSRRRAIIGSIAILCLMAMVFFAPGWVAMIGMGDLFTYFDITIIALLLSAVARSKSVVAHVTRVCRVIATRFHARFVRPTARSRSVRLRKPKSPTVPDEDGAGWQGAAAIVLSVFNTCQCGRGPAMAAQ